MIWYKLKVVPVVTNFSVKMHPKNEKRFQKPGAQDTPSVNRQWLVHQKKLKWENPKPTSTVIFFWTCQPTLRDCERLVRFEPGPNGTLTLMLMQSRRRPVFWDGVFEPRRWYPEILESSMSQRHKYNIVDTSPFWIRRQAPVRPWSYPPSSLTLQVVHGWDEFDSTCGVEGRSWFWDVRERERC